MFNGRVFLIAKDREAAKNYEKGDDYCRSRFQH
jgi:hypothetical protein